MPSMEKVKLHGFSISPFSHRVVWALKLKGIPYEYIEEDLRRKGSKLIEYNPVHKKIPVLVHQGRPICESLVILEYIEETWPENPLLPSDVYERATARFWINFGSEKDATLNAFLRTTGKAQRQAVDEGLQVLKVLEEHGLGDKKFFGGESINLVDISYGWLAHWFQEMEEVAGVKLIEPGNLPRLHAWVQNFKSIPVIRENLPDRKKLSCYFGRIRERTVAKNSNG